MFSSSTAPFLDNAQPKNKPRCIVGVLAIFKEQFFQEFVMSRNICGLFLDSNTAGTQTLAARLRRL